MLEAGRRTQVPGGRTQEVGGRKFTSKRKGRRMGARLVPIRDRHVHKPLSYVLVAFDVAVADLIVAIGLDIRLTLAEVFFSVVQSILGLAVSLLHFAFGLLAKALKLLLFVIGHFTKFLLRLTADIFHLAFDLVAVHCTPPMKVPELTPCTLNCRASSAQQLEDQSYDGEHQQQVNKSTKRIAAHHPDQPKNQQNHENRPKHSAPPMLREVSAHIGCIVELRGWVES